jgi:hypothetical protein
MVQHGDHFRSFRVLIRSNTAISGNNKDGIYKVNLPIIDSDKNKNWQYDVETFCFETNDTVPIAWIVDIPTFTQRNSYSSLTQNTNSNIILLRGGLFFNSIFDFSQLGIPLNNINVFVNGQINIRILNCDGVLCTDMSSTCVWTMILTIWEIPHPNAVSEP